jgi:Acetyl-coenzyme A transporter 1
MCSDIGGTCITERDGYFITTGLCLTLGVISLVTFIVPTARRLQGERFCASVSLRQKLKSFLCSFAGNKVAHLYMIHGIGAFIYLSPICNLVEGAVNYSVTDCPKHCTLCTAQVPYQAVGWSTSLNVRGTRQSLGVARLTRVKNSTLA